MFEKRLQVQIVVGSDAVTQGPLDEVRAKLAAKYGGLTMLSGEGLWAVDGDSHLSMYGDFETEAAYVLWVTMVPDAFDMGYIQEACMPLVGMADWIHVEVHETQAAHFSLEALAAKLTAA